MWNASGCSTSRCRPKTATSQTARKALDASRVTRLDRSGRAFAAALKQAGPDTHVIYIGDGIVTTGNADAVEFTKRLQRLYEGQQAKMHAVTVSSRYEVAPS